MKISTLGPEGTFSHEAALKVNKKEEIILERNVWDIFETLSEGKAGLGVVPIENSVSGTVGMALDALLEFDLNIVSEEILQIRHNLANSSSTADIKDIFTTEQAYEQCVKFLRKSLPDARIIETSSNAQSAKLLKESGSKSKAAIIPEFAAKIYGLKIIKKNIQDSRFNVTRFIVISKKESKKSGNDRTSIFIYPQVDKAGLLYSLLGEFAKRNINLTKIESRPSKGKLGDYVFFIEMQGHKSEKKIQDAFAEIEKNFFLKVAGSYERKY